MTAKNAQIKFPPVVKTCAGIYSFIPIFGNSYQIHMITGELKSKIDRVWDAFWTGGLSNPITVIEQMTYLLFIRRLDELHTLREQKAAFLKKETVFRFP